MNDLFHTALAPAALLPLLALASAVLWGEELRKLLVRAAHRARGGACNRRWRCWCCSSRSARRSSGAPASNSAAAPTVARRQRLGAVWGGTGDAGRRTSLPELATGTSAVAWVEMRQPRRRRRARLLRLRSRFPRRRRRLRGASRCTRVPAPRILTAAFGVIMLGFVTMNLLLAGAGPVPCQRPGDLGLYVLALSSVNRQERGVMAQLGALASTGRMARALAAVVVLGAGAWLPEVADRIAALSRSQLGTLWLAFATSLPRDRLRAPRLRMGAHSTWRSPTCWAATCSTSSCSRWMTPFHVRGPLLADAARARGHRGGRDQVMTGLVMVGLVMRPQGRALRVLSW